MNNNKKIKTDNKLAAPYPTANSSEFVPLPVDNINVPAEDSEKLYDFIPAPKGKKYGR